MSEPVSREFEANNVSLSLNNKYLRMEFNLLKQRFEESQKDMQLKFQSLEAGQNTLLRLVQQLVPGGSTPPNRAPAPARPLSVGTRKQPRRNCINRRVSFRLMKPTPKKRDRSLNIPSTSRSVQAESSSVTSSVEDIADVDDPKPLPRRSSRSHSRKPGRFLDGIN